MSDITYINKDLLMEGTLEAKEGQVIIAGTFKGNVTAPWKGIERMEKSTRRVENTGNWSKSLFKNMRRSAAKPNSRMDKTTPKRSSKKFTVRNLITIKQ